MTEHTISDLQTGGVPQGMTAWEAHQRALAARAVRLQDEHAARVAEKNAPTVYTMRNGGRVVSPMQALIDEARAARAPKKLSLLERLLRW